MKNARAREIDPEPARFRQRRSSQPLRNEWAISAGVVAMPV
jgi:hypothetical protein